jgi:hypothetical protein
MLRVAAIISYCCEEQSKSGIAPQNSKSCKAITNNISANSPSKTVIARGAAQSEFEGLSSALQSNPKLGSTVSKTLFWIAPQTIKACAFRPNVALHFS